MKIKILAIALILSLLPINKLSAFENSHQPEKNTNSLSSSEQLYAMNCSIFSYGLPYVKNILNNQVAGYSERISRRKRFVVHGIDSIYLDGCNVVVNINATLKRKIRRDAHGIVTVAGNLSYDNYNKTWCVQNIRITKMKLSRTLRIGERIYTRFANKNIPNQICVPPQYM